MTQDQFYLDQLPQPALELCNGVVSGMNAAARACLPDLIPGAPAPDYLTLPLTGQEESGCFQQQDETFLFTRLNGPEKQILLFRSTGEDGLTSAQVEGFSRQMRAQLGRILSLLELLGAPENVLSVNPDALSEFNHSFHQILRLVNNLEFLNIPMDEARAQFHPVTMDLAGLCRRLSLQAAPLLREAGVNLRCDTKSLSLLVPGDPVLLERMLLALISNAAKAARGGSVVLELRERGGKATLTVSERGGKQTALTDLLPNESARIPDPDDGAGMGLSVVRRIVELHGGVLLSHTGADGALSVTVSLPAKPLSDSLTLNSPHLESNAGISPVLLELSDLLPVELFQVEPD